MASCPCSSTGRPAAARLSSSPSWQSHSSPSQRHPQGPGPIRQVVRATRRPHPGRQQPRPFSIGMARQRRRVAGHRDGPRHRPGRRHHRGPGQSDLAQQRRQRGCGLRGRPADWDLTWQRHLDQRRRPDRWRALRHPLPGGRAAHGPADRRRPPRDRSRRLRRHRRGRRAVPAVQRPNRRRLHPGQRGQPASFGPARAGRRRHHSHRQPQDRRLHRRERLGACRSETPAPSSRPQAAASAAYSRGPPIKTTYQVSGPTGPYPTSPPTPPLTPEWRS